MGLLESLGAGVKAVATSLAPGTSTPFSNWGTGLMGSSSASGFISTGAHDVGIGATPGSRDDYSADVGDVSLNGVVSAGVSAIAEAFCSAPIVLEQRKGEAWNRVEMHPCIELLQNPNPFYGSDQLWEAEIAGELITGSGYFRAVWNQAHTQPVELWHEGLMAPVFDARQFISSYHVFVDGRPFPVAAAPLYGRSDDPMRDRRVDHAIHFRYRLNRRNPRFGEAPLGAVVREIAGDNIVATYQTGLVKNGAAVSFFVTAKEGQSVTAKQMEEILSSTERRLRREGGGRIGGSNLPVDFHKVSFSPDELALEKLPPHYESRICAAIKTPAMMLGFSAGEGTKTYCLPAKARVWTPQGNTFIKDIRPGSVVWSFVEGVLEPRKVLRSACVGVKQLFEIKTKNRTLRATGNHPVLVRRAGTLGGGDNAARRVGHEWKRVDELVVGDHVVQVKATPDLRGHTLPDGREATPQFMQWAGAFIGDGCFSGGDKRAGVIMCLPKNDRAREFYVQASQELFQKQHPTGKRAAVAIAEWRNGFGFGCTEDARELVELGLSGTAHTKRVPSWVFGLSRDLRLAFLAGIVDTDGSVNKLGSLSIAFCNQNLAHDVRQLLVSVGIACCNVRHYFVPCANLPQPGRKVFYEGYAFTASSAVQVAQIPFTDPLYRVRVEENANRHRSDGADASKAGLSDDLGFYEIKSIAVLHHEKVYDIEVEGGHSFVADGVVVHNSNMGEAIRDFWQRTIIPYQKRKGGELEAQLFPLFGMDKREWRLGFDRSQIAALQDDERSLYSRLTQAVGAGWMTPNEARGKARLPAMDGGDVLVGAPVSSPQSNESKSWNEAEHSRDEQGKFSTATRSGVTSSASGDEENAEISPEEEKARDEQQGIAQLNLSEQSFWHDLPSTFAKTFNSRLKDLDGGRDLFKDAVIASHATIATQAGGEPDYNQVMTTWADRNQGGFLGLSYNERMFASPEILSEILERSRKTGHLTIEDEHGLLNHEFGHVLERSQPDDGDALRARVERETRKRVNAGGSTRQAWLTASGKMVFGANESGDVLPSEAIAEAFRLQKEGKLPEELNYMADIFQEFDIK